MSLSFFTNFICPLIGTILCIIMWISPFQVILKARELKTLGTLNPTPFAISIVNCIGWVMYSIIQKDYFIFFANSPGIILGIFYAITSMVLIAINNIGKPNPFEYRMLEISLVGGPFFYTILALIVGIALPSSQQNTGRILVAVCTNCCTVMYYASPLTSMYTVIKTKDSSSLHPPMLFANLSNSTMWFIYGLFALNDPFVYGPNGIGATLALSQLTLSFLYSKKSNNNDKLLDSNLNNVVQNEKTRFPSHESFSIESNQV